MLESIVGHDFLPRGPGIVTRCPLKITLQKLTSPSGADGEEEWDQQQRPHQPQRNRSSGGNAATAAYATFGHKPEQRYDDFADVRAEIERETSRICGTTNDVCDRPIQLTIHAENMPDLNLVDLPGLVKVPRDDQPSDIAVWIVHRAVRTIGLIILTSKFWDCPDFGVVSIFNRCQLIFSK